MGTNPTEAEAPDLFAEAPGYATHEVLNQAGAVVDYDAYGDDKPLVQAIKVFGADWPDEVLHRAGRQVRGWPGATRSPLGRIQMSETSARRLILAGRHGNERCVSVSAFLMTGLVQARCD